MVQVWQSRASSHSSYYTVVANFESRRKANEVLARLPDILNEHFEEMARLGNDEGSAVVSGRTLSFCGHYNEDCQPSFLEEVLKKEGALRARVDHDTSRLQTLKFLIPVPDGVKSRSAKALLDALAIVDEGYRFIRTHSKRIRMVTVGGSSSSSSGGGGRFIEATYVGEEIYSWHFNKFWVHRELNSLLELGRVRVEAPWELLLDRERGFMWPHPSEK